MRVDRSVELSPDELFMFIIRGYDGGFPKIRSTACDLTNFLPSAKVKGKSLDMRLCVMPFHQLLRMFAYLLLFTEYLITYLFVYFFIDPPADGAK